MSKKFASQTAVDAVTLEVRPGEFFSLLGPSGCGKTTLLRMIAGFETPTAGELSWDGGRIDHLPPQQRPFNMVFQRYALFPHMSVFENVAFGLKVKRVGTKAVQEKVRQALQVVGLLEFQERLPETLSGGQAQRVALARAIVNEPKILLLDEPLSALDQKMREHMQSELRELQKRIGITFIMVTHDQEEALALSDRIAVMNAGRLEQVATPRELYDAPATHFVAQFVGSQGSVAGMGVGKDSIRLPSGKVIRGRGEIGIGKPADAFIRPERIRIGNTQVGDSLGSATNHVASEVTNIGFKGLHFEVNAAVVGGARLRAFVRPEEMPSGLQVGSSIELTFKPEDTFLFERPDSKGKTS